MLVDLRLPDGPPGINGFVTFFPDGRPGDLTELSNTTCLALDAFWRNGAREKRCHFGTTRETVERTVTVKVRVKRKVRVKVAGKWMTKTKTVVESRRVIRLEHRRVPILLPCADSFDHLLALWVLAHEAEHLAGTQEEAVAECRGLQTLMFVALRLGADPSFAREMAAEAWRAYPELRGGTEFYSTDCRDGGPLDLNPASPVWP